MSGCRHPGTHPRCADRRARLISAPASNALKCTESGGVRVALAHQAQADGQVALAIRAPMIGAPP